MTQINQLIVQLKWDENSDECSYLLNEIIVDSQVLVDFSYFATDLEQLGRSIDNNGEFFIISCWCGIPDCTGIAQGIRVQRNFDIIHWEIQEPQPKRTFTFDQKQYKFAFNQAIKQSKQLILAATYSGKKFEITPDQNEQFYRIGIS